MVMAATPQQPLLTPPPAVLPKQTREQRRDSMYSTWKAAPTPEGAHSLLQEFDPLIQGELGRFGEAIAAPALKAQAKRLALDAFRSYDPTKGAGLGTHVVNQLRRLYRSAYESSQAMRMSEELQAGTQAYQQVKSELAAEMGREPTISDLRDRTGWPLSRIERLEKQMRGESAAGSMVFDPGVVSADDTDARIDYVYNDLAPRDKQIFQWTTGHGGSEALSKVEIAKRLGVSPVVVSQRAAAIAKRLMEGAGLA